MGCQEAVPMVRMFVIFYLGCPLSEGGFGQSHLEVLGCFGVSDSFVFLACTCDAFWKEELHVCFVTSRGREQDFYGKDGGLILASKIEWRQSLNPDHPVLKVCTMCIHVSLSCCVLAPKKKAYIKNNTCHSPRKRRWETNLLPAGLAQVILFCPSARWLVSTPLRKHWLAGLQQVPWLDVWLYRNESGLDN